MEVSTDDAEIQLDSEYNEATMDDSQDDTISNVDIDVSPIEQSTEDSDTEQESAGNTTARTTLSRREIEEASRKFEKSMRKYEGHMKDMGEKTIRMRTCCKSKCHRTSPTMTKFQMNYGK